LDLVGIEMPKTVSSKQTSIFFDSHGKQIENLDFSKFEKKFEIEWETFKQLDFQ
jgi:hypothetical protein